MPDYVIGAVERLLNNQLDASTPARRRLETLAGRRLGVTLLGPEIELVLAAEDGALHLTREADAAADVAVTGTPLALLEALRAGKSGLVGRPDIVIAGDVHVLESFTELLRELRPDFEEMLAGVTGDIVAHESVRAVAAARNWGRRALAALAMNTGEYLQEESRALPARHEIDAFVRDVESLRDDVERAAARLRHLQGRRAAAQAGSHSAAEDD